MRNLEGPRKTKRRGLGALGIIGLLLTSCAGQAQTALTPAPRTPLAAAPRRAEGTQPQVAAAAAPPTEPTTAEALEPEETRTPSVPTRCEEGVQPCSTPAKFVERVCRGKYPELALVLLAKGTPWRRGYVKAETVEPVNTYDGERSEEWLSFGEEVLILRTRGPASGRGIQMSGPTDVDVLRWDGTCATIRQEMLAPHATDTRLLAARVAWKYLDTPIQEALLKNPVVQLYSEKERPACRGSTMKHPDERCDKASRKLTDAIAVAVRGGSITLPTPAKVPSWAD